MYIFGLPFLLNLINSNIDMDNNQINNCNELNKLFKLIKYIVNYEQNISFKITYNLLGVISLILKIITDNKQDNYIYNLNKLKEQQILLNNLIKDINLDIQIQFNKKNILYLLTHRQCKIGDFSCLKNEKNKNKLRNKLVKYWHKLYEKNKQFQFLKNYQQDVF